MKVSETFNGLHGVISQKTELFIITVVGTSDPTNASFLFVDNFKGKAMPVTGREGP
jgi:hypothetical protein